jgi:ligand-binding sensor domain-containing protein/signal transduction histidine kinase
MKVSRCLFWLLFHLAGTTAFSQKQQIRFTHLSTEQGLSQSNVTCILQDARGFMWFGTRDGLNKYDSYGFTVYKNKADDPGSLSNNFITSIIEDKHGGLWIGTWGGGLDRFDSRKAKFVRYSHDQRRRSGLSSDFINSLIQDSRGNIWIGTNGGGLDMLDPVTGKFTNYAYNSNDPGSISDNDITRVFEDSRHRIWVGSSQGGLCLFNPGDHSFTRFLHNQKDSSSLALNSVWRIFEDSRHRLWIGTRGGGLDLMDLSNNTFRHFKHDPHNPNSLARDIVFSLAEDDRENLWIGTENGGLSILHMPTGVFSTYLQDDIDHTSLSNNSIHSLYKDARNNMWVGTYSGGVNLYNKNANLFAHYAHSTDPHGLSNNSILNFHESRNGLVWVATDGGGVDLFDPKKGTFSHFTHRQNDPNSICGNYVLSVQEDPDKKLWIGTVMDGTTVYDPSKHTFRHLKARAGDSSSISGNNVAAMLVDRDEDMWIGTYGDGLNLYDRKTQRFRHFRADSTHANSLSSDRVVTLLQDSKGYLWIGTFDGGVDRLDKRTGAFTHYRHTDNSNSLSSNNINHIYEDSHGRIWICTAVGLNLLDPGTGHFTVYASKDGLPSDIVFGILEDNKGMFWISSNGGLSRLDPAARTFTNFSAADGLQSNEFKAHSCFKSATGALYFGGVNGFNVFYPDSIKASSFDPPLLVTGFQIFNKEVPVSDDKSASPLQQAITDTREITLSYKNSVISFEFASLNYTVPEKKQYAYMLEGFDKKWNDIGSRRMATYTNLDPGAYVFKVRGLTNDGKWSGATTSILLTITPPFWQTWWFRLLVIVTITGSGIAFHRIRMGIVKAQKKKLEQQIAVLLDKAVAQGKYEIASDVLHDIGNAVVGFGSYLTRIRRLLDEDSPEKLEKLAGFFEAQRQVLLTAIGEPKSGAVITLLGSIAQTQRHHREEMRKSITEQLNIISQIQEILNIQRQYISGQESHERKPVNFRTIINDCISMLFTTVDKSSIAISLDLPEEPPVIKGDRTRLMQMILHVLKNSIEAIDIDAAIKTISLRMHRQDGLLVLQVRDSGKGFDQATGAQLFQRGFTTKSSGSGLGLYQCRTIAESHEGAIDLTSDGPGKGALATIRFGL